MRKIVRFMSHKEAMKLLDGQKLVNNKHHKHEDRSKTDSVGFCFTSGKRSLYENMRFLSGIVDGDVALVGEIADDKIPHNFVQGYGVYARPVDIPDDPAAQIGMIGEMLTSMASGEFFKSNPREQMRIQEWSTCEYSLADFESWGMYIPAPEEKPVIDDPMLRMLLSKGSHNWEKTELVTGKEQYV